MEGTKLNGESSSDDPKDFDDILVLIGEFGTFQRLIYTLLALACMLHSVIYVAVVFIEETPGHRCKIPGLLNDTNNVSIPNETGVATQQCTFIQNVSHQGDYSQDKTEPEPCTEWVFDTSTVTYSYPMQFGLICTDSLKLTQSHIMLIAGSIAGAPVFGSISDSLGRRFSLLLSLSVSSVLGLAWALTPSYLWGIIIRFVYGLTSATINSVGTTAGLEIVGPGKRMVAGTGLAYVYAAGGVVVTGMAFFLRDWRHLQITISALLFLLAFTLFWCLPESPRWLLTKGRKKIAEKILRRTARINGTEFPEGLVEKVEIKKPPSTSARALLHAPNLMIKLLLIIVNWIVIDMAYYGIFLHAGNMSGNLYLNVLFYSLVEFPACALCFTIDRFGRKRPYIMCVVIGGLSCLSTLLVQYYASDELESTKYTKIALSVVGKLGVSAAYCILYIWSIEIFPTVIRNFCLGVGAVFAGVGSILSPIIVRDLKVESIGKDTLPLVIFGAMSIFGAICTIPLPETAKRDLPETIADAEKFPLGLKCTADDSEYQKPPLVDETTRV